MHGKTFVCLCRRIVSPMYTIFNMVHDTSDMNNTSHISFNTFEAFMRVKSCIDRQVECINTLVNFAIFSAL